MRNVHQIISLIVAKLNANSIFLIVVKLYLIIVKFAMLDIISLIVQKLFVVNVKIINLLIEIKQNVNLVPTT